MTMEVDYATNPTRLYESIHSSDWTSASRALRLYPAEASTWVIRRDDDGSILWRFLPLHSALARNPPSRFVEELISAYPRALKERDVNGMLPLHYAVGNRCNGEIMEMLLRGYAGSVWEGDGNGMTPLHYVGAYGCVVNDVLELMLDAAREEGNVRELVEKKDSSGKTPLMLAREGEYAEKHDVVNLLEQCFDDGQLEMEDHRRSRLQVITAQSPRSHAIPRSARNSPRSRSVSRGRTSFSSAEIVTDDSKEKIFHHHVISPRVSGSTSGEYPIHMMDGRSSLMESSPVMNPIASNDFDARNDAPGTRSYSLESPRHASAPHSMTSTMPNIKAFESSNACNMKTPRSSGRGGRFGFDYPPPSPRYPQSSSLTSPRGALLSPRAQPSPVAAQASSLDVMVELQRLQLENESLQQQLQLCDTHPDLRLLQAENANLRAKLAEYEQYPTYNTIAVQQTVESTGARLSSLLTSLQRREEALTSIIQLAEQRENARLQSYTSRKQELLKLLAAEENEKQKENVYLYQGATIGVAFGKELKGLEEVRGEVGRVLEGLKLK